MKKPDLVARDTQVFLDAQSLMSRRDIALKHHISEARVSQILRSGAGDTANITEDDRNLMVQQIRGVIYQMAPVMKGPGRAITSGKGDHVIDEVTGEPAYDPSPKTDAARVILQCLDREARLLALDLPPAKVKEDVVDVTQFLAAYSAGVKAEQDAQATISKLKAQLAAVEGAVEAEVIDR